MFLDISLQHKKITKRVFWAIAALLVTAILSYAYFLNTTVSHIVERQQLQEEVTEYNTKLSEVEFTYIQLQNKVTLERARTLGFRQVENPRYVTEGEAGPTLSFSAPR